MLNRCLSISVNCPNPCFFGIDTPTRAELIGAQKTVEQIREHLEVDSLHYLSPRGLVESTAGKEGEFCLACFTGDYPTNCADDFDKLEFDREKSPATLEI